MAKYYGKVGYVVTVETKPGVWSDQVEERSYTGDLLRNSAMWSTNPDSTNDEFNISNQISIVSDTYAMQNFQFIKYLEFMGAKWKVTNVQVQFPRLILTIGGLYNG